MILLALTPLSRAGDSPCSQRIMETLFWSLRNGHESISSGIRYARDQLERASNVTSHFYEGQGAAVPPIYDLKLRGVANWLTGSFAQLSPVPMKVRWFKADRATKHIFKEQWWKALEEKDLTPENLRLLEKYNALKTFQEKQAFMKAHPHLVQVRKSVTYLTRGLLVANAALTVDFLMNLKDRVVSRKDYLKDAGGSENENEVSLLVESVPFPHTALRIGKKVYSYGVDHVRSTPVSSYFRDGDNPNRIEGLGELGKDENSGPMRGVLGAVEKGFSALPRSVTVIPLKLTEKERNDLKRDLELATGKRYENRVLVNDCSTMIARALARNTSIHIPEWVDALPTVTAEYLLSAKNLGVQGKVGAPQVVLVDPAQEKWAVLARNALIANIEGKVGGIYFSWTRIPYRWWFDATTDEKEIEVFEPQMQARVAQWKKEIRRELEADDQFKGMRQLLSEAREGRPLDAGKFNRLLDSVVKRQIDSAQARLNAPDSDMNDIVKSQIKIDILDQMQREYVISSVTPR